MRVPSSEPPIDRDKSKLEPDFVRMLNRFELLLQARNLPAELFEGFRSAERQAWLYAKGRTLPGRVITNAGPGESVHQYGRAADYVFKNGQDRWTWSGEWNWDALGNCAKAVGMVWGGDWRSRDCPHVQHTGGLSWRELKDGERPSSVDPNQLTLGLELLRHGGKQVKIIVNNRYVCSAVIFEGSLFGPINQVVAALGLKLHDHIEDQGKVYIYR